MTDQLADTAAYWASTTAALFTPAQRAVIRQAIAEGRVNLDYYRSGWESDDRPTVGCMLGQVYGDWYVWGQESAGLMLTGLPPVWEGRLSGAEATHWEQSTLDMLRALGEDTMMLAQQRAVSGRIAAAYLDAADFAEQHHASDVGRPT